MVPEEVCYDAEAGGRHKRGTSPSLEVVAVSGFLKATQETKQSRNAAGNATYKETEEARAWLVLRT